MTADLLDRLTTQAITIKVGSDKIVLRCPSPEDYIDIIDFAKTRDAESADGAYAFRLTAKCLAATVVGARKRTTEEWEKLLISLQVGRVDAELAKLPQAALSLCGYHTDITPGEGVTDEIAEVATHIGPNPSGSPAAQEGESTKS